LTKSLKKELIFKKLIEIRKTKNFTQRQLARRLSVYQSYVSKVELGQKNLNIIELEDYLKGLNYSLIEFLKTLDKNVT
jgi:transcriptional regulator with XRE-family HTH domain